VSRRSHRVSIPVLGYHAAARPASASLGVRALVGNRPVSSQCRGTALTLTFSWSSQRLRRVLAASAVYQSLVLIVRTYPEPVEDIAFAHGERSIRFVDADAPQPADWLQVQGRMCGVLKKELKLLVRGSPRVARNASVEAPELLRSTRMKSHHSLRDGGIIGLNFPARISALTSSITWTPRPPGAKSLAICRSHSSIVWKLSHVASAILSSSGSPVMASLIASTVMLQSLWLKERK